MIVSVCSQYYILHGVVVTPSQNNLLVYNSEVLCSNLCSGIVFAV
jgi:hypothetical protein